MSEIPVITTEHEANEMLRGNLKHLQQEIEALTPGGSEFHNDPKRCIQWIKERLSGPLTSIKTENERLQREKDTIESVDKMDTELQSALADKCEDLERRIAVLERENETLRKALHAVRKAWATGKAQYGVDIERQIDQALAAMEK